MCRWQEREASLLHHAEWTWWTATSSTADTQDKPSFLTFVIHYHVPSFKMSSSPLYTVVQFSGNDGSRHGLSKNVLRSPVVWSTLRLVGKAQIAVHMISHLRGLSVWPVGSQCLRRTGHTCRRRLAVFICCWGLVTSAVDTSIPLLASSTVLETLGGVIDLARQKVWFGLEHLA